MTNSFGRWFFKSWRQTLLALVAVSTLVLLFCFQLGSLVPGMSDGELSFISSADSGKDIFNNPLFLPQKLVIYGLIKLGIQNAFLFRLPSVGLAIAAVVSLLLILRGWYSQRIALMGAVLLASSSWLLSTGRLALSDASYLLLLPLLWLSFHFYTTHRTNLALLLLSLVIAGSLYIPGAIWLILLIIVWKFKSIWETLKSTSLLTKFAGFWAIGLLLTPLVISMALKPELILVGFGLPDSWQAVINIPKEALNVIKQLIIVAPFNPQYTIGRLPLLDIFTATMVGLGLYNLRFQLKLTRAKLQITALLVLWLLVAGGGVNIVALLPLIYVLAAGGMAFLIKQWLTVFPRNPLAQSVGTILLSICLLLVAFYHINRYFIAWPQTPATKVTFRHTLIQ